MKLVQSFTDSRRFVNVDRLNNKYAKPTSAINPCQPVWKAVVDVPCNLQRVVEDSTTRCRLHGTSTTAFHTTCYAYQKCEMSWLCLKANPMNVLL